MGYYFSTDGSTIPLIIADAYRVEDPDSPRMEPAREAAQRRPGDRYDLLKMHYPPGRGVGGTMTSLQEYRLVREAYALYLAECAAERREKANVLLAEASRLERDPSAKYKDYDGVGAAALRQWAQDLLDLAETNEAAVRDMRTPYGGSHTRDNYDCRDPLGTYESYVELAAHGGATFDCLLAAGYVPTPEQQALDARLAGRAA